jgi:hypothetical protein
MAAPDPFADRLSYRKVYKSHIITMGNHMANNINQFRREARKPDGTRYSYKEAATAVIAHITQAQQVQQ